MNVPVRLTMLAAAMVGMLGAAQAANAALYQQDFEGYADDAGIGVLNNPTGTGSTEWVDDAAGRNGSAMGWRFFAANQNGQRFRAYDSDGVSPVLTQDTSFALSFWINNYQKANSASNVGFVGLFDANATANSTNGLASMKHFIGVNLGGVGADRDPVYGLVVDAAGAGYAQHPLEADIAGGFAQWYRVSIGYDATSRLFSFAVSDGSNTLVTDSYTLPGAATFTVNAFGGSNGVANDGRSMGVYVDDVTVVPEPASMALVALGGLLIARRRG